MRIDRLDLIAFGPFTDVSLDLSGGSEGLHLVFGPNEAGKSSALRAIRQVFCGFPARSPDDFVHAYDKLRVGVALRGRDGSVLEAVRRKGTKNTLLTSDGAPLDGGEARLARMLGGAAAEEFDQRFLIDHAELIAGGRSMSEGGGALGPALFATGGRGLALVGNVRNALEDEAGELFLPRGARPRVNADLAALEALRKAIRDAALPSSEWIDHDRALRDNQARKERIEHELIETESEQRRLQRLFDAVVPAARRRGLLAALAPLADTPRLSKGFANRRLEARSILVPNERAETEKHRRIEELSEALAAIDVPEALLDRAETIEHLFQRLGSRTQAAAERQRRDDELARLGHEVRAALRDLGRDPDRANCLIGSAGVLDESLESLRLTVARRAEVRDLAENRHDLSRDHDDALDALDASARARAETDAALAALGPERDPGPLRQAIKTAQAFGDINAQIERERDALARDEARAAVALAALDLWSGPIEAIERLPLPSADLIDQARDEFDALDRDADALHQQAAEIGARMRTVNAQLEQLRLEGDVPTEDALIDARRRRDVAWHQLKEARVWDMTQADAFETAARHADALADRLRREAGRVAERARLLAERSRLDAAQTSSRHDLERVEARRAEARSCWIALWAPVGIADPPAPRAMLAWVRRQADLATLARAVREAREQVARLEARRDERRRALSDALTARDEFIASPDESLVDLLERAGNVAEADARDRADRKRLRSELETLDRQRPGRERTAESARRRWEDWQTRWSRAVGGLGLPPDASTAVALDVLDRSARLFETLERVATLHREAEAATRDAQQFADDVRALAEQVAPDLTGVRTGDRSSGSLRVPFDSEAAAASLYERLKRARETRNQRDHLIRERASAQEDVRSARTEITRQRAILDELRREAHCTSDDALPEVEQRDRTRAELEAQLANLDGELERLAAGTPLDAFLDEVGRADPDALAPRIARLTDRANALKHDLEAVNQAIGRERAELDRMTGGSDAADLKQQEKDLEARVKNEAEQYARLRLAAAVLKAGIERYREKARGPVLARASALFARLTLGSFTGLRIDFDDRDEPVLLGVRPSGDALGTGAMSLGTADQLYLALRLATIEDYLDRHEPLPLIVDDILIQFDDARVAATIDVLAELSMRTQVLLFTHHEHLVRLAETRVASGVLFHHTLSARAATMSAN